MSSHILEGFHAMDRHEGGHRTATFRDGVLMVTFQRSSHGDYLEASEAKHFRLVEVEQQWVEVAK